jgi:RNA polymerase sigma-70 factor (ECF subfamily)
MATPSREDPDRPLVERWRKASRELDEVFQEIVKRHTQRVARLFDRKGHPAGRVQELTQETFLRVFQGLGSYRGDSHLGHWILLLAEHLHCSEVRRIRAGKRQGTEVPLDGAPPSETEQLPADVTSPWEDFAQKERDTVLRKALTELSPQRKRCVELHYFQGCTMEETAQRMGLSPQTVKAHLYQARQWLGEALAQLSSEPAPERKSHGRHRIGDR